MHTARGRGEIVERAAGAPQFELDRGDPRRLRREAVQPELDRAQRPAQLVRGARDEHQPAVRAQLQRDEHGGRTPAQRGDQHPGPSTSR